MEQVGFTSSLDFKYDTEYVWERFVRTELDANRKPCLKWSCAGRVVRIEDEPEGCSAMDLLKLLEEGGAAAVVVKTSVKLNVGTRVNEIPVFVTKSLPYRYNFSGKDKIRILPTTMTVLQPAGKVFRRLGRDNANREVLEQLKAKGVHTKDDAVMFLVGVERMRLENEEAASNKNDDGTKAGSELVSVLPPTFTLKDLRVGGLGSKLDVMLRRAFLSRLWPPSLLSKLGVTHIRGVLLFGPPGCGKTLIARELSKVLNAKTVQILSGPEIHSKWCGESEKRIRKLFEAAEEDFKTHGDRSPLHVIIIDEIDAMCPARTTISGSSHNSNASNVNQFLAKLDGVHTINNILVIGLTNRKEAIDKAVLRPGRLEVHIEIKAPDEKGRLEILEIHTEEMRKHGLLDDDEVCLSEIAKKTNGFSGADLAGVVKAACSYAMERCIDPSNLTALPDESKLRVTSRDMERGKACWWQCHI